MTKEEEEELNNLLDARKKIDARIKELKNSKNKSYGSVVITKGENARNSLWRSVYRVKIKKHSSMIDSENGRYKAITEDTDFARTYIYLKQIYHDLNDCITDMELALNAAKHEDTN